MPSLVTAFVERSTRLFHAGEMHELARHHSFPLPVEQDGQLVVFSEPRMFIAALSRIRATLLAGGLTGIRGRLAARELRRDARFRIWVSLDLIYPDRIEMAAVRIVQYCNLTADGIQIEMVEMLHNPSEASFLLTGPTAKRCQSA